MNVLHSTESKPQSRWPRAVALTLGIIATAAVLEWSMGHTFLSKSGHVRLWVGAVNSSENSQQIADWYSFSHLIHGFLLYGLLRLANRFSGPRHWPLGICLVLAMLIEASWEVTENTSFVINRYREATLSLDYYGDSILNSVCDMLFCIAGFFLAARLPVWLTITLAVLMELGVGYAIRDNLTLNIIMLVHPFEAIKHWQMALP